VKSLYVGKTAAGREIWYPDVSACLTAITTDYTYMSWEGDVVGNQHIVRISTSATTVKVQQGFGTWANRATLSYQYIQP
jgi:hypothetical protein